jgi:hypothetical protein
VPEFLAGVVVGVALGVAASAIGGPLLGAVLARYAGSRQDREDERVLRAFLRLSNYRDPNAPVAIHEVREVANVSVLSDSLERLQHKGHITRHPDEWNWFTLTDEGLRAASEPQAWRRRGFGG